MDIEREREVNFGVDIAASWGLGGRDIFRYWIRVALPDLNDILFKTFFIKK